MLKRPEGRIFLLILTIPAVNGWAIRSKIKTKAVNGRANVMNQYYQ